MTNQPRETRFRVWSKDYAQYLTNISHMSLDMLCIGWCVQISSKHVVEMYTGFKDSEGKDVFENDVVWNPESVMYGGMYMQVRFISEEGRWAICRDDLAIAWDMSDRGLDEDDEEEIPYTVKGNVHQNGDLLNIAPTTKRVFM